MKNTKKTHKTPGKKVLEPEVLDADTEGRPRPEGRPSPRPEPGPRPKQGPVGGPVVDLATVAAHGGGANRAIAHFDPTLAALSEKLGKNPVAMYLARLANGSRATQLNALTQICRWLGGNDPNTFAWHALRYEHTNTIRTLALEAPLVGGEPRKPSTANRYLAALRGVLTEAWRLNLMDTDSYMRAKDVKDTKDQSEQTGRELSVDETDALMAACEKDTTVYGIRDAAMLLLLSYGLRRFEVTTARLDAYNQTTGELSILGKGKRSRRLFLSERSQKTLATWLAIRPEGEFIISALHDGSKQLTTQTVYDVLVKRALEAGLTESFAAHDFRRTFVSRMLAKTGDLAIVQRLVGHSDPKTTAGYDRRGDEALKKATEDM